MAEAIGGIPLKHESVTFAPTCIPQKCRASLRVVRPTTQSQLKTAFSQETMSFHVLKGSFLSGTWVQAFKPTAPF